VAGSPQSEASFSVNVNIDVSKGEILSTSECLIIGDLIHNLGIIVIVPGVPSCMSLSEIQVQTVILCNLPTYLFRFQPLYSFL
jgi:hypothetical protein